MPDKSKKVKVRKAVIAAAGLGKRMFPFTKIDSKLLIPILNKPVILYILQELIESGIEEVTIVTNHDEKLKELFKENKKLNSILERLERRDIIKQLYEIEHMCKINFVRQDEPYGWLHAVLQAKKYLRNEPFIVCFSDIILKSKPPASKQLIDQYHKHNKCINGGVRFLFTPGTFKAIQNEKFEFGRDVADLDLIHKLRQKGKLIDFEIDGDAFDVGEPAQLLRTLIAFTLEDSYYFDRLIEMYKEDDELKDDFDRFFKALKKS